MERGNQVAAWDERDDEHYMGGNAGGLVWDDSDLISEGEMYRGQGEWGRGVWGWEASPTPFSNVENEFILPSQEDFAFHHQGQFFNCESRSTPSPREYFPGGDSIFSSQEDFALRPQEQFFNYKSRVPSSPREYFPGEDSIFPSQEDFAFHYQGQFFNYESRVPPSPREYFPGGDPIFFS